MDDCPIRTPGNCWQNLGDGQPQDDGRIRLQEEVFAEEAERPLWVVFRRGANRPVPDVRLPAGGGQKPTSDVKPKLTNANSLNVSPLEAFDDVARNYRLPAVNARQDVLQSLKVLTCRNDHLLIGTLALRRALEQPAEAHP